MGMGRRKGRRRRPPHGVLVLTVLVVVVVLTSGGHSARAFPVAPVVLGRDVPRCLRKSNTEPAFLLKAVERSSEGDRLSKRNASNVSRKVSGGSPKKSSSSLSSHAKLKFRDMQDMIDSLSSPDETLLIVFTSAKCGPCKLQSQELSEFRRRLTKELQAGSRRSVSSSSEEEGAVADAAVIPLKMLAIDTEKWPHVGLSWFRVSKLPCTVVLRNKQVVARMEGLTLATDLLEHVRPHLPPHTPLS